MTPRRRGPLLHVALALAGALAALPGRAAPVDTRQGAEPDAAQGGRWLLRARGLKLDPGIHDTIGLFVTVEPLRFTELDLSWFATRQLAFELAVTVPQRHAVKSAGFEVGQLRQLPPTLLAQWHFGAASGSARLRPYVGAGISWTRVSNLRFSPGTDPVLQATVRNNSIGPVLALGLDLALDGRWSINLDAKALQLRTDLAGGQSAFGEFKVRPVVLGAGLGLRF